MIVKRTLELFSNITRFNVSTYLESYRDFIRDDRSKITAYYSGDTGTPDESAFSKLSELLATSDSVDSLIELHKHRLSTAQFWELIEMLSDMKISLQTIDNSSKWLRSSIEKNNFSPNVELKHVLKQRQTLENLSSSLGSSDPNNDWITVALRNDLAEEKYTPDGGVIVLSGFSNRRAIKLKSVVDNIRGENIYGLDLNKIITFVDDDLDVLSYRGTIHQTASVLSGLKQGQTPEFPTDGIQQELIIGQNKNSLNYPVVMRQFFNTFRKDDTLKSLSISNIEQEKDSILVEFTVKTRLDETVVVKASL